MNSGREVFVDLVCMYFDVITDTRKYGATL